MAKRKLSMAEMAAIIEAELADEERATRWQVDDAALLDDLGYELDFDDIDRARMAEWRDERRYFDEYAHQLP